jgi:hypothetical protein
MRTEGRGGVGGRVCLLFTDLIRRLFRARHAPAWYTSAMAQQPLSTKEAAALREYLAPIMRRLARVNERLQARGYTPNDELWRAGQAAYNAVHAFNVQAHYASCQGGVGRSE